MILALSSIACANSLDCGTGQATPPFAQRGDHLVCLDIRAALFATARQKFAAYPNVEFDHGAFEAWPALPTACNLVMSTAPFHRIAPEIGYYRAMTVVKDTGSPAIFANKHRPSASAFAEDLYQIEQRIVL